MNFCHFPLDKVKHEMRLKNRENLRTASLKLKFTGSYKKSAMGIEQLN